MDRIAPERDGAERIVYWKDQYGNSSGSDIYINSYRMVSSSNHKPQRLHTRKTTERQVGKAYWSQLRKDINVRLRHFS